MPRKSSIQTTAKKHSNVPPKATTATKIAESVKPVMTSIPTAAVAVSENAVAAKPATTQPHSTPSVVVTAGTPVETPAVSAPATLSAPATVAALSATTAIANSACTAASAASVCHHSTDVSAAIQLLQDADADIARDAATALGGHQDKSAVEPLIAVLNNSCGYYHSVVRAAAAESLGNLGDSRAIESLLIALTDPIAEVSSESIRALATLGDSEAVDALVDVVRNRAGFFLPIARRAAVFGLVKLGGDRAAETLAAVAGDEFEDPTIRQAAESVNKEIKLSAN